MGLQLVFAVQLSAQQIVPTSAEDAAGYLVGPGDKLEGKVLGEPEFDFVTLVDETGKFEIPFVDEPILAECRTESDIRADVKKLLSKYLRDPLVSVQVTERRKPIPVTVFGEVRNPQRVELRKPATLLELLAFSGGVNVGERRRIRQGFQNAAADLRHGGGEGRVAGGIGQRTRGAREDVQSEQHPGRAEGIESFHLPG